MGRITIFGTNECPHCMRAKGALLVRGISFVEIDLVQWPERRADLVELVGSAVTIPQVFLNSQRIGGADELLALLQAWDNAPGDESAHGILWRRLAQEDDDPIDPRLAVPPTIFSDSDKTSQKKSYLNSIQFASVNCPDGMGRTVPQVFQRLQHALAGITVPRRPYKAHWYKHCFINTQAIAAVAQEFHCTAEQAVAFLQRLQSQYQLLHHVCNNHMFRDDGYYFFRLCCHHTPHILNSYLLWSLATVEPACDALTLIWHLKTQLYQVLARHTDHNGLVDYIQTQQDPNFVEFEVAVCALQVIDMAKLDETTRKTFGLNLYNLWITYAFVKVGVATSSLTRGAFFSAVKLQIGPDLLSLNDLEHGILRANTRHPYASKRPFPRPEDDEEHSKRLLTLPLQKLDARIHFALNCGARSCPPIRFFQKETLEEELELVSQSFCQEAIRLVPQHHEIHLSMLFKWYQADFLACSESSATSSNNKNALPAALVQYLTGEKKATLENMLKRSKPIGIRYLAYDWTAANASNFKPFSSTNVRANEVSATAILRFQGHFEFGDYASSSCRRSTSSAVLAH